MILEIRYGSNTYAQNNGAHDSPKSIIMQSLKLVPFFIFLFFTLSYSIAQDIITIKHSCSFDGEETNKDFYTFNASNEANQIVGQIVDAVYLARNFVVKSADCKNALATVEGKQRYILYNTSFLENFKKESKTKWAAYCVLAHEIGHHLNNHDFEEIDNRKRRKMELEADKFGGGVLYTLGASLEEAKAGIDLLQNKGETKTHPPARARIEAIANGWKNSQEQHKNHGDQLDEKDDTTTKQPNTSTPNLPPSDPGTKKENWEQVPGSAQSIDVGADGSVWAVGTNPVFGGFGLFYWNGSNWKNVEGGAVKVAVNQNGTPWVISDIGFIYRRKGNDWEQLPGAAKHIDIGADGSVWAVGIDPLPGGFSIYRWEGTEWKKIEGSAVKIAVSPSGVPWAVNELGFIFRRIGNKWELMPGLAKDIAFGADGSIFCYWSGYC